MENKSMGGVCQAVRKAGSAPICLQSTILIFKSGQLPLATGLAVAINAAARI